MPKHVLIVDDDHPSADTHAEAIQFLSKGSITTEVIYGGKDCLERLSNEPRFGLIMLDLDMPKVNGADVLRYIVEHDAQLPPFCILVTTAWGDWQSHWGLEALAETPEFKKRVINTNYDKIQQSMKDLIGMIEGALIDGH